MKKLKLNIFIDALGWEVIKKRNDLFKFCPNRKKVEMQFGYSSTALPTILTGESPEIHEAFNYFYYNPKKSPFKFMKYFGYLRFIPKIISSNWRFRNQISKFLKKVLKYTGYFQIYNIDFKKMTQIDYSEKTDIFKKGAFEDCDNLADIIEISKVKSHITPWQNTEEENLNEVKAKVENGDCNFIFLYLAKLDSLLHQYSKDNDKVESLLQYYNQKLEEIVKTAHQNYDDVEINIFSDHGMTEKKDTVDLMSIIKNAPFAKEDYFAIYDATMLRIWFHNKKIKRRFMKYVQDQYTQARWLTKEEKLQRRIDFRNNKYGEEIFLMNPGIQIAPSDMSENSCFGMHGYDVDDKDSYACFLTNSDNKYDPNWVGDFFQIFKKQLEVA